MAGDWQDLTALTRAQADEMEAWEAAELHLLQRAFSERLAILGIDTGSAPEVAVALMAVAQLLAEHTPEWGGDARAPLAEIARLGLALLDE